MTATDDFLAPSLGFLPLGNPGTFLFQNSSIGGVRFGGASVNMVIAVGSLFQYTILADRCIFNLVMNITNKGTSNGNATLLMPWGGINSVLGFAPGNGGVGNGEAIIMKADTINLTGLLGAFLEVTATGFNLKSLAANGAAAFLTDALFASPSFFTAVGHFQIAPLGSI